MITFLFGFNEAHGQLPITESFRNTTATGLTFGGSPGSFLTAPSLDANGSGFLRLTGTGNNETGFARSTGSFVFNKGVAVEFEYYCYFGGNPGADGITFFLYDASATFNVGAFGGSLGYAQKNGPIPGVSKGFIGIGLDEYGNFARPEEGRSGGPPPTGQTGDGYYASTVTIRGSGDGSSNVATNYEYLTSVKTNDNTWMGGVGTNTGQGPAFELIGRVDGRTISGPNSDGYRKVLMSLVPDGLTRFKVSITITENSGGGAGNLRVHEIIRDFVYTPDDGIPANLSYGFGASTGGSVNFHEIRNIEIIASVPVAPEAFNDVATTLENQSIIINVLTNDRDQNGNGTINLTSLDLDPTTAGVEDKTLIVNGVGTYVANNTGTVTFTPVLNYNGTAPAISYSFKDTGTPIKTSNSGLDVPISHATVIVTVTGNNSAPSGTDKTIGLSEDGTYTFAVSDFGFTDAADSPAANALQSVTLVTLPAAGRGFIKLNNVNITVPGTVVTSGDISGNNLKYQPLADDNGTGWASFTFQVRDNGGTANSGTDLDASPNTITLNVNPVNDIPSFTKGGDQTVAEDSGPQTVNGWATNLVKGPVNEAAQTLSFQIISNSAPLKFSAGPSVSAAGILTYTPAANAAGTVTITLAIRDDGGVTNGGIDQSVSQSFTITLTPANDAPAGTDKTITSAEDADYTFAGADFGFTDPSDDPPNAFLTVKITTIPLVGILKKSGVAVTVGQVIAVAEIPTLVFTPVANASGTGYANFTFQVQDNGGIAPGVDLDASPNTITFNITAVNDLPVVANVPKSGPEDVALTFIALDFTSKFSDIDTDALTKIKIIDLPANGVLKLNNVDIVAGAEILLAQIPNITFVPSSNFNGAATFKWNGSDGTAYATIDANVNITIDPVNDAPTFTVGANQSVIASSAANTVNGWATVLVKGPANEVAQTLSFTVTNNNNTLFSVQPAIDPSGNLSYTLAGTAGTATVTALLKDNGGTANGGIDSSTPQTFTITATSAVTNAPPTVQNITKIGVKDQTITFTAANFSDANFYSDPENVALVKIKIVSLPANGTLKLDGVNITVGQEILAADLSKITFVPATGYIGGPVSFQWNGSDGTNYAATPKNVNITINAVNTAPVAVNDAYTTTRGGTLTVALPGVLTNDTDANGNPITAIKVTDPPNGTVTLNANGSFVYTHNGGSSNSDVFTYKVNDGLIDGNTVSVTITISTGNSPPVVTELQKIGTGFTPITFTPEDFRGKFTDPNSDPLVKIIVTTLPALGTLKLNGVAVGGGQEIPVASLGNLTFEPPVNWSGTTVFGWNGFDGTVYATNAANVSIQVLLTGDPSAKIGLAKSLGSVTPATNGTYDVKFIFTAINYGLNTLENVSIKDNLLIAFGGATVSVKSIVGFGNLKANNSFNGSSDTELLLTTSKLSPAEQARIELVINVKLGLSGGLFQNTATAQGTSVANGVKVTDVSTNGLKPDPLTVNDVSPLVVTPIQLDSQPSFVPQGFSPNGDGQNDKFVIQNAQGKLVSLEIYNRWGNRVYKSADYKNDWGGEVTEGFFLGRDIPDGTYYYIIIIEKKDKYAGFITINR